MDIHLTEMKDLLARLEDAIVDNEFSHAQNVARELSDRAEALADHISTLDLE
jgi:hypothetical protein